MLWNQSPTAIKLPELLAQHLFLPPTAIPEVAALFETKNLERGDFHFRRNHAGPPLGFLLDGYLRSWTEDHGREVTQWVFTPDYFVADLQCMLFDRPARFNVQALTHCRLAVLSTTNYARLPELVPNWAELEKQLLGRCFTALKDRVFTFLALPARERYAMLLEHQPELFNQVPLKYLASMLGMSAETLSRLRRV